MVIPIQIGMEVSQIEREPHDVVSIWDQPSFHGRVRSNQVFLSTQHKHNTLLHVPLVVKPFGFGSC